MPSSPRPAAVFLRFDLGLRRRHVLRGERAEFHAYPGAAPAPDQYAVYALCLREFQYVRLYVLFSYDAGDARIRCFDDREQSCASAA